MNRRRALEELEILTDDAPDDILSKGERDSWTSDKTTRRLFVAKRYRVLLLIGDDLNDFVWAGYQPSADVRRNLAWTHANMWGHRWFIIPNANYGGWERAVYGFNDALPRREKIQLKKHSIQTRVDQPEKPK